MTIFVPQKMMILKLIQKKENSTAKYFGEYGAIYVEIQSISASIVTRKHLF